jgi:selenocysteine-specific elongation factor
VPLHVVGTAGHVDHGKSSLVLALTGTDPDRLAEEKRRGMTIELGFAEWTLPGGEQVGVIDVPGHARFVRTMLAGAQGIDLVLLVIAADEGVMPQTREHLAICELLGAQRAVVALSKADLVDAEMLELAAAEAAEVVGATSLRGAPVVACSALDGSGLDELARTVERALAAVPASPDRGRPRLFVDRAFSLPGFGPVVTGTLEGGALHAGEEVAVLPAGLRARIRGLQRHGDAVATAAPGGRTAINLAGVEREELGRGMAVVLPGSLATPRRLDVALRTVPAAPAGIRHGATLSLHMGTAETAARVWLLDAAELAPGENGFAQLTLSQPIAAAPGDRFVLRRPAPAATLGGGEVLDVAPRRHRRRDAETAAALERRRGAGVRALVGEELAKHRAGIEVAPLARAAGAGRAEVDVALRDLAGDVVVLGKRRLALTAWERLMADGIALLGTFHDADALAAGMPREEWRARLRLPSPVAADAVQRLRTAGLVEERGPVLALPGRGRHVDPGARRSADAVAALLSTRALDPPTPNELRDAGATPALLRLLIDEGRVVRLRDDVVVDAGAYATARAAVESALSGGASATVAQLRDAVGGASRKLMVPLLEHLDRERVTLRDGDLRRLRNGGARH